MTTSPGRSTPGQVAKHLVAAPRRRPLAGRWKTPAGPRSSGRPAQLLRRATAEVEWSRVAGHGHWCHVDRRRTADVVDDVQDDALTQRDCRQVMELDARRVRRLEGVVHDDAGVGIEEDIAAQSPCLVGRDVVGYLVGRVAVGAAIHEGGLIRLVIADLVLEEDGPAVLAVPDDVPLLIVLDEEPGGEDVVAVHGQTGVGRVGCPAYAGPVVGAPGPDVVDDGVVAVDGKAVRRLARKLTADPEEDVLDRDRVAGVAGGVARGADGEQGVGLGRSGIEEQALEAVSYTHLRAHETR